MTNVEDVRVRRRSRSACALVGRLQGDLRRRDDPRVPAGSERRVNDGTSRTGTSRSRNRCTRSSRSCTTRRTRGCRRSTRSQAPDRKTHELIRMVVTVMLAQPRGRAAPRAARARGRRDVGGDPRLDHADDARARAAARGRGDPARPCGLREPRAKPSRLTASTAGDRACDASRSRRSASCRGSTDRNRDFWTGGEVGELRFWRCQDCRLLHPPAAADLPDVPLEEPGGRSGVGPGDARDLLDQPPDWMPGPELPVRRRDRRDRRAAVGAAHDQPRQLPARRDPDRHAGAR